jgi:hypothetical protein
MEYIAKMSVTKIISAKPILLIRCFQLHRLRARNSTLKTQSSKLS